jgi:hypothetical protein
LRRLQVHALCDDKVAGRWTDDIRLSDLERRFAANRGADVRPLLEPARMGPDTKRKPAGASPAGFSRSHLTAPVRRRNSRAAYRGIDGPVDHFHLDRFLRIANHLGSRSSKLISETASRCDASGEKLSCTTRENASPTAQGFSESHCGRKHASTSRSASGPIGTSTRKNVRCAAMRRRLSRCRWVSDLFALAPSPTANPRGRAAALRHQARHNRAARKSKSQT